MPTDTTKTTTTTDPPAPIDPRIAAFWNHVAAFAQGTSGKEAVGHAPDVFSTYSADHQAELVNVLRDLVAAFEGGK